jgi:shikimate kinase
MNIYLIGYRCTGKTSVGKELASKLNMAFIDSDKMISRAQDMSIAEMVRRFGWSFFRKKEKKVIAHISGLTHHVVATGGGVIDADENTRLLKKSGTVIWLKAMPKTIALRMKNDPITMDQRPSLTNNTILEEINITLQNRRKLYQSASDFSVSTDRLKTNQVCETIIKMLKTTKTAESRPDVFNDPGEN